MKADLKVGLYECDGYSARRGRPSGRPPPSGKWKV